jgi:hypothetical protein
MSAIWSKMYFGLHIKNPSFLSDDDETCKISTNLRKILICQISWKSVKREPSCSMRTEGQAWRNSSFFAILRKRLKNDIGATTVHVTCVRNFIKICRLVQKSKWKHLIARALMHTFNTWNDNENLYPSRILNPDSPVVQTAARSLRFLLFRRQVSCGKFLIFITYQYYASSTDHPLFSCQIHITT